MSQDAPTVLLYGDVDAIKEFVFDTSALPQISGGSLLLVKCEEEIRAKLQALGGKEIYCSGGSFLFRVPSDRAEAAKRAVEELYLDKTGAATVTVVYEQELPPDLPDVPPTASWARRLWQAHFVQAGGHRAPPLPFAQRVTFLAGQLRDAKAQKARAPFWEAPPFGQRCDLCGKRVAHRAWRSPEGEEKRLCPVCWRRYEAGKGGGFWNEHFGEWAESQGLTLSAQRPVDLDHLVNSARDHPYLAFLYADGNDIGRLLQCVGDEEELRKLSQILRSTVEEALFEALKETCGQALGDVDYWPFEIVHIGGDDVSLLIQAGYAWEVAVAFLEQFEGKVNQRVRAELEQLADAKITASCGIAIADPKYPVRYLEKLAEDVLRKAKRKAKEDLAKPCSAVNFLWLPSPVAAESAEPLLAYYESPERGLTVRPYALGQACSLVPLVEQALKMPRTLRHRWAEALEKGPFVSLNTIYYDIARRGAEEQRSFQAFLRGLGNLLSTQDPQEPPAPLWKWDASSGKWRTALLDVLELAELRATRPDVEEMSEEVP